MGIDTIVFKGVRYPGFQAIGNASQFAIPYAKHFCKGKGLDVGCSKPEWAFPGAFPIDISLPDRYNARYLPEGKYDYVFSSHCLEHIPDWVGALEHWVQALKDGGVLFLYLPHYDQEYWRPWYNKKHDHIFTAQIIGDFLEVHGFVNVYCSGRDLNYSFMAVGEKRCES